MRTTTILTMVALSAAFLTLLGCFPTEDSCNIKTDGVYVQFEAIEEGDSAIGKATFWVGDDPGGTNLELGDSCDDQIAVNGTTLSQKGSQPIYYEAAIDVAETYEFVFTREGEDPYTSTVTEMRPEVTVLGPSGGDISRADEFEITWEDNDGGEITLLIDGDCIWDYPDTLGDEVADNGSHTVPADGIEATDSGENESCTAEITLTREVPSSATSLDPSLKGEIDGKSVGRASFTSTP